MTGSSDVFVVIRCAGERTQAVCERLVREEIPPDQVQAIQEVPFALAVQRTFSLGAGSGRKWTAAIDADVLMRRGAFADLIAIAEQQPDDLFALEGRIWDKLFGGPRSGGIHLYRSEHLSQAAALIDVDTPTSRPELTIIQTMCGRGFLHQRHEVVVGIHDFFQYDRDYFRKGISHSKKFSDSLWFLRSMWSRLADEDRSISIALQGLKYGLRDDADVITDAREFEKLADIELAETSRNRQQLIDEDAYLETHTLDQLTSFLQNLKPAPEYVCWNAWLEQYQPAGPSGSSGSARTKLLRGVKCCARWLLPKRVRDLVREAISS